MACHRFRGQKLTHALPMILLSDTDPQSRESLLAAAVVAEDEV